MIDRISEVLAAVSWEKLSPASKEKLKQCIIANFSVAVAGLPYIKLPEPDPVTGTKGHLLFSGRRTPLGRDAAFWNAAVMHSRTQDDFHPIGNLHAATVMMPAAMSAAEATNAAGVDFLNALIAGYSAAAGLSSAFSPITTPKGLRSTGLYAPFAAAAAAGRLCGLDAPGLGNAIALTASMAAGLTQCWIDGSDEWQLHVAQAAFNGLLAVDLTAKGVIGGAHALDGKSGFFQAHTGTTPAFADIAADFDPDRAVLDTVIKRYPLSGIGQPVVHLAERMAARRAKPEDIQGIVITMNPFEMRYPGTLNKGPFRSFSDILMSVTFCTASVFSRGRFEFSDLFERNRTERDRLIAATEVHDDQALPTLSCRIDLKLAGGATDSDSIIDGGKGLAIDVATIDEWALGLWREAGRSAAQYERFRAAVDVIELRPAKEFFATLVG